MARSIWNGVISFGMVSIPVRLATAVVEKDLSFHQIHGVCGSRIKYQKFCPVCERVVENTELKRGYELAKGKHVVLEETDFENLPVPSLHTIEVVAFVKAEDVDPIYFDKTYYIEPSETGVKPFALLMKALKQKEVAALGKVALRNKENPCLLRFTGKTIVLETLHYPDEIREPETTLNEDAAVGDKELNMALSLVDLLSDDFDPAQFKDDYRQALMERIEAKAQGGEIKELPPVAAGGNQVIDLVQALQASLDAAKGAKKKERKSS